LSDSWQDAEGIILKSLAAAAADRNGAFERHFNAMASGYPGSITAWNTTFFQDGLFLHVTQSSPVRKRIHLLHLNTSVEDTRICYPRNLIVVDANCSASVFESHHSIGNHALCVNAITEIHVGQNAKVDFGRLQNSSDQTTQIDHTLVVQEKDSVFSSFAFALNGGLIRNNLNIRLDGTGCETNMHGLSVLSGSQHADHHTFIDHARPHCLSNELYKTVLDGESHGVFSGRIMVRQDAQKTNAFQSSKNILLSQNARMDAKPQLEIFADDVKCSHGATTGRLNDEAMFYLQARGIGKERARALLVQAFAGEVIDAVQDDAVREKLLALLASKLDGGNQ
jgi:Fe-S cluster assembly protein SufD